MWYVQPIDDNAAEGPLREQYENDLKEKDYISNTSRAWSHRPEIMQHWFQLSKAVRQTMRLRSYELIVLAAARAIGCKF